MIGFHLTESVLV